MQREKQPVLSPVFTENTDASTISTPILDSILFEQEHKLTFAAIAQMEESYPVCPRCGKRHGYWKKTSIN